MIILFHFPCWEFDANRDIAKGTRISPLVLIVLAVVAIAPIAIRQNDVLLIDIRTGHVEVITRSGIAIYRAGWKN